MIWFTWLCSTSSSPFFTLWICAYLVRAIEKFGAACANNQPIAASESCSILQLYGLCRPRSQTPQRSHVRLCVLPVLGHPCIHPGCQTSSRRRSIWSQQHEQQICYRTATEHMDMMDMWKHVETLKFSVGGWWLHVTQMSEPNLAHARRNRTQLLGYDHNHLLMNMKLEIANLNLNIIIYINLKKCSSISPSCCQHCGAIAYEASCMRRSVCSCSGPGSHNERQHKHWKHSEGWWPMGGFSPHVNPEDLKAGRSNNLGRENHGQSTWHVGKHRSIFLTGSYGFIYPWTHRRHSRHLVIWMLEPLRSCQVRGQKARRESMSSGASLAMKDCSVPSGHFIDYPWKVVITQRASLMRILFQYKVMQENWALKPWRVLKTNSWTFFPAGNVFDEVGHCQITSSCSFFH